MFDVTRKSPCLLRRRMAASEVLSLIVGNRFGVFGCFKDRLWGLNRSYLQRNLNVCMQVNCS